MPGLAARLARRRSGAVIQDRAERLVDDRRREVYLVLGDGERGRHPQAARLAAGAAAYEVDREPAALTLVGERQTESVRRLARLATLDELEAAEQAEAAHVADVLVALLQLAEPCKQVLAAHTGPLRELLLLDDIHHRQRGSGWHGI